MTLPERSGLGPVRARTLATLLAVLLVGGVVAGVAAGPAAAHETETVDGYELTFGGADEPVITDERMWLELEIVDEDGEPVTGQADTLTMDVEDADGVERTLELDAKHGEPGYYEAPVVFTEPGTYTIHIEGTVEESEVHTHFEKEVQDRSELAFPDPDRSGDGAQADAAEENPDDGDGEGATSLAGPGFGFLGAVAAVGVAGAAFLFGRD